MFYVKPLYLKIKKKISFLSLFFRFENFHFKRKNISNTSITLSYFHICHCGGQLNPAFKLHWRRPGPISSLICINSVRKGQAQYPV